MSVRITFPSVLLLLLILAVSGCGGADPSSNVAQNLSDALVLISGIDPGPEFYTLRGRVISAVPVGGSVSMAEPGQEIALTPYYGEGGRADGNPAHERLAGLAGATAGDTVQCRITLDSGGAWRIVSTNRDVQ